MLVLPLSFQWCRSDPQRQNTDGKNRDLDVIPELSQMLGLHQHSLDQIRFIPTTIKYHPLLLSLCLFIRNGEIRSSETLFCIIKFSVISIIWPYKMTPPDEQKTAALVNVCSVCLHKAITLVPRSLPGCCCCWRLLVWVPCNIKGRNFG